MISISRPQFPESHSVVHSLHHGSFHNTTGCTHLLSWVLGLKSPSLQVLLRAKSQDYSKPLISTTISRDQAAVNVAGFQKLSRPWYFQLLSCAWTRPSETRVIWGFSLKTWPRLNSVDQNLWWKTLYYLILAADTTSHSLRHLLPTVAGDRRTGLNEKRRPLCWAKKSRPWRGRLLSHIRTKRCWPQRGDT